MISIARPLLGKEEEDKVLQVLRSGMISSGEVVKEFEGNFAAFIGTKFALAASSGTTALHLALQSSGIMWQDKVITTPFSFIATANSILYCGAVPVFADIDEKTYNIDPEKILEILENVEGIKAVLVVHLFGLPCDMDRINAICKKNNLILIEDCAQAHGASYNGKKVGSFGNAATFSFYPTKNMTTGEGGILTTSSEEIFNEAKFLREHGAVSEYIHQTIGYNYRMTNIEAAIGICQLKKLEKFNKARRQNAGHLMKNLKNLDWLVLPHIPENVDHVFHQFTIRLKKGVDRLGLVEHLRRNKIGCKVYYPMGIHQQPFYQKLGYRDKSLPVSEEASLSVLSLPVHPGLSGEDLNKIVEAMKEFKP